MASATTLGLSLTCISALGGFTAAITNPSNTFGSGSLVLQGSANGSTCTSSATLVTTDAATCGQPVLPTGTIPPASTTPATSLVQESSTANTSGATVLSLTLTLGAATKAGNLLVVAVTAAGNTTMTITDSGGNAWSNAIGPVYNSHAVEESAVFYAADAKATTTITVSFGTAVAYPALYGYEIAGAATSSPLDVTGSASPTKKATIAVATSASTTTSADFVVEADGTFAGDALTATGWTVDNTYATSGFANSAYQSMTAAQVANFTTTSSDKFEAVIAAFKAAPATAQSLSGSASLQNLGTVSGTLGMTTTACGALGASDSTGGGNAGLIYNGVSGATGPFTGSNSLGFDGTGWIETTKSYVDPTPVSEMAWFKTTGGGTIMGATTNQGNSGQTMWDRQIWIDNTGHVVFGVYNPTFEEVVSPSTYNNGAWHYVVATIGPAGEALYVDGVLAGTNTTPTAAQNYTAYWHIGWDSEAGAWPDAPTSPYFVGDIADVAVFPAQLTNTQIQTLYTAGSSQSAYATAVASLSPTSAWPLQNTVYLYPYAIPGGVGASPCGYAGVSAQETNGGTVTCLLPAGAGACPTLNGTSDPTLSSLASGTFALGGLTNSSTASLNLALVQEGTVPAAYVGLHPTLGVDFSLTQSSWIATLAYSTQGLLLG